ncbi:glucans biosynthesis glucosyltransferase MdoH [Oryzibacter oryziterrae]|uniref:glucans biosynthesis glucosyltransferase MdoH n=1 Tax=Oryzibacter oryziterrae TaxID=2766474 RepID=UPI001F00D4D3|nr:glucans biosynthesis glucosyltransferase MdoH [Oryzibacter oryziterrae]
MDGVINKLLHGGELIAGMPSETPGEMPPQNLSRFDRKSRRKLVNRSSRSSWLRRLAVLGGTALLLGYAFNEMYSVLALGDVTPIEWVVLVLFTITFAWIALSSVASVFGFLTIVTRHFRPAKPVASTRLTKRTAMLMPTYNEDPSRVFASIEAMARDVESLGQSHAFDWFVLADTTDPEVVLQEETALLLARRRLGRTTRIYYRRRRNNTAKKAGNVADFCRRWASAYDHLLVLDADSLMDGHTIVELARRMEADPDAGLIQTIPQLVNGTTIVARLQQFAGRVYGPVVGTGLSWWVQKEGNFWGHNAIIRRAAFLECAGLPELPGKAPFGGHIMSHDFVEAALIRRAGWNVIIADDLNGSFEESPPSLVDLAIRDRRWCQGNLQHVKVIGAKGLHWISRMHILTGIMSYLASPLWLLLILAGFALTLQAHYIRPEYFKDEFQLFPSWPRIDAERALALFGLTMSVLFVPKVLGLIAFLFDREQRRASGGVLGLILSFVFEAFVSALIAPIMMLIQTGAVSEILMRRDAGWKPQRRDDGGLPLKELVARHRWHVLIGMAMTAAAYADSWVLLAWLSPALIGMLLAVPISGLTGSMVVGRFIKRLGLLRTPEEKTTPQIRERMEEVRPAYEAILSEAPDIVTLVADPAWNVQHLAIVDHMAPRPRGRVDPVSALVAAKVNEAESVEEAVSFLDSKERATLIATPHLLEALKRKPLASLGSVAAQ